MNTGIQKKEEMKNSPPLYEQSIVRIIVCRPENSDMCIPLAEQKFL